MDQRNGRTFRRLVYQDIDIDIVLLLYDMTRRSTLENIVSHDLNDMASYVLRGCEECENDEDYWVGTGAANWMTDITAGCGSNFQIILVGTKADSWEDLNQSGTEEQKSKLTTWQQGYDVPTA